MEKIDILVIDDNKDLQDMLVFVSKEYNIRLESSYTAKMALERKDLMDFNVILVDLAMPEMNGDEFIKIYRELGGKAMLIIISSYIIHDLMGADAYLHKPFSITSLIKLIYQNYDKKITQN